MRTALARGKFSIGIGLSGISIQEFRDMGAPLENLIPLEGTYISASYGGLSLPNRAPHPNAAKLFINWLLTREGQTVFARAAGSQSNRLDVPTDHLQPSMIRQPGVKYFESDNEEIAAKAIQILQQGVARQIFGIK